MSYGEEWEPSSFNGGYAPHEPPPPDYERPEKWFRDNSAVFYALEQWQKNWFDHAERYEQMHGRLPSSMARDKNKAAFRRMLVAEYGRGEPDSAWLDYRIRYLEKRGQTPERRGLGRGGAES